MMHQITFGAGLDEADGRALWPVWEADNRPAQLAWSKTKMPRMRSNAFSMVVQMTMSNAAGVA